MQTLNESSLLVRIRAGLAQDLLPTLAVKFSTSCVIAPRSIGPKNFDNSTLLQVLLAAVIQMDAAYILFKFAESTFQDSLVLRTSQSSRNHPGGLLYGIVQLFVAIDRFVVVEQGLGWLTEKRAAFLEGVMHAFSTFGIGYHYCRMAASGLVNHALPGVGEYLAGI